MGCGKLSGYVILGVLYLGITLSAVPALHLIVFGRTCAGKIESVQLIAKHRSDSARDRYLISYSFRDERPEGVFSGSGTFETQRADLGRLTSSPISVRYLAGNPAVNRMKHFGDWIYISFFLFFTAGFLIHFGYRFTTRSGADEEPNE